MAKPEKPMTFGEWRTMVNRPVPPIKDPHQSFIDSHFGQNKPKTSPAPPSPPKTIGEWTNDELISGATRQSEKMEQRKKLSSGKDDIYGNAMRRGMASDSLDAIISEGWRRHEKLKEQSDK